MKLSQAKIRKTARHQCGFTLLEVMLVIVVVGFMATMIVSNLVSVRPEDQLKKESEKFVALFNLANEYALLNNVELGLVVKEDSYQFVGFDGVYWRELENRDEFTVVDVKQPIVMSLKLDDLPIEEPSIIDQDLFKQEESLFEQSSFDQVDIAEKDDADKPKKPKVKIIPQVYVLSGGEITPFNLSFEFDYSMNNDAKYTVKGEFSLPLTIDVEGEEDDES